MNLFCWNQMDIVSHTTMNKPVRRLHVHGSVFSRIFPWFGHKCFFIMKLISKHEIGIRNGIVMPKLYRKEVSHRSVDWLTEILNFDPCGWRPSWISANCRLAQTCHTGNQAKFSLETHISINPPKNNTLLTATRFTIEHIRMASGLSKIL